MESYESLIKKNMKMDFICDGAGGMKEEFIASTTTILKDKPTKHDLEELKDKLGSFSNEFIEFFSKYNGALFFKDTLSDTAGLEIHSIKDWDTITEEMLEWYEDLDEDELEEYEIDCLKSCVAFAEVPHSGNYFFIPLKGNLSGQIVYSDHDGLELESYASSLQGFLTKFLSDPVKQIYDLGCYARYSDNKTDIQWIPRKALTNS